MDINSKLKSDDNLYDIYVKNDYDARIIKSAGCWYLLFCAVPKGVLMKK